MQSISQNRSSANSESPRTSGQLPIWPEAVRGGPNAILRSALFAGIQSKKRQILGVQTRPDKTPEGVAIASQDGIRITFAGTQFNQYDADVFFETLHRARRDPLETECRFQGAEFLRVIGRSDSILNYEDLEQSLDRLRRGSIELEWDAKGRHYKFVGSLIAYYIRESTTKTYKVSFAKEIATLFAPASWTQLEWNERQAIKGKPLSQWLHSYFSTHAAPFPVSVAFLHEKSGSPTTQLKHFKVELKNALETLNITLGWIIVWNRNLVSVDRTPSASQMRHIGRKIARSKQNKTARQIQDRQLSLGSNSPTSPSHRTTENMSSPKDILAALLKAR